MIRKDLADALNIEDADLRRKVNSIYSSLELIPGTFYALFWLYSYDFLYLSKSIETVLQHPFEKFEKHGMVFFQSIIPPRLFNHIYNTMREQEKSVENHPDHILLKECLKVEAAVYNKDMQEVPVAYNAVLLDAKQFEPISYLVLCSWTNTGNMDEREVDEAEEQIMRLFFEIKECYISSKPEHFNLLLSGKNISEREKEVALLLMQGHSSKSISDQLQISFNTVESHRKNLLGKLSSKNTAELIYKLNKLPL